MKRSIYAALAIATLVLTGCATSHSPFTLSGQIYSAMTPNKKICKDVIGKSITEAEAIMNVGKIDAAKFKANGEELRIYSKGNLRLELSIDVNGKVSETNCTKITDNEYK